MAEPTRVRIDYSGHSEGHLLLELYASWAPGSCERFLRLVDAKFLEGQRFVRCVQGFVLDWNYGPTGGSRGSDAHSVLYKELPWAKVCELDRGGEVQKCLPGTICFGQEEDGTTKTEVFINLVENRALDGQFIPFGRVIRDEEGPLRHWQGGSLEDLNFHYDDIFFAGGASVEKAKVRTEVLVAAGNAYIDKTYPGLSWIVRCERL